MILAGDIGGTNTRLAAMESAPDGKLRVVVEDKFPSRAHGSLSEIVTKFLGATGQKPASACFGIAGPVKNGRCETTNLAWVVDAHQLARLIGCPVTLLNDLEANASGIAALEPEDLVLLSPGAPGAPHATGNAAIISAGTGLGEAGLFWDGARHRPIASEGGHCDFAPGNELEDDLLRHLRGRFGAHVSWERVLSGPGLVSIYEFFRKTRDRQETPAVAEEMLAVKDPAPVISRAALEGRSPLCEAALDLFCSFYGAEAGNVALKFMATGGVYLGGGIAPRIEARLRGEAFRKAFVGKGRLAPLLEQIPVRLITNDRTALLGAARAAALGLGNPTAVPPSEAPTLLAIRVPAPDET